MRGGPRPARPILTQVRCRSSRSFAGNSPPRRDDTWRRRREIPPSGWPATTDWFIRPVRRAGAGDMMASAGFNMPGGGDAAAASSSSSAAQECRLRRRRRLAPPPHRADAGAGGEKEKRVRPSSPSSSSSEEEAEVDDDQEQQQQPGRVAFGWVSVAGRSREMEDAVSLRPAFCTSWLDGSPIHFFGVFDGHGGSHVRTTPSIFYVPQPPDRLQMHEFLAEELATEAAAFRERGKQQQQQQPAAAEEEEGTTTTTTRSATSQAQHQVDDDDEQEEERAWRAALSRAFDRVDALASVACACGRPPCRCPLAGNSGIVGSTAVVALLVRGRLVVANCGDSRAVLCRGHAAVPLSVDHKVRGRPCRSRGHGRGRHVFGLAPETRTIPRHDEHVSVSRGHVGGGTRCRRDGWWVEATPAVDLLVGLARIEAAGGRVLYINGHRVRGILAMMLRPEVIAEPEITVTRRTPEDECLILATDGMWDVISNDCLQDDDVAAAAAAAARCSRAASLLVRLALGRAAWDNVSVIVVDLKHRGGS
ncbi:hypothetical protein HU200_028346 [Digitaria exilis]|uniref:protein-serine/threonine phosphatase n=1 Tax=Digitaria exilis TaxID=1010633 RepID=A0A835BUD5_9POAL|nr:hypothetical protein HU200_028346 [Digitaria exilis]